MSLWTDIHYCTRHGDDRIKAKVSTINGSPSVEIRLDSNQVLLSLTAEEFRALADACKSAERQMQPVVIA